MSKEVLFGNEARNRIKRGVDIVADAVKQTLGAKGRNVFIDDPIKPKITNDGVTIAHAIKLEDKFENMGAWVVQNASGQTNDNAGDGTTTTALLVQSLVDGCFQTNENPMQLRHELKELCDWTVKEIKKVAKPIKTKEQIAQVAEISAESKEVGEIISHIIEKIGKDGVIAVDESRGFTTDYEITDGYEAPCGYASYYYVTNPERMEAVYKNVPIMICDKKVGSLIDLQAFGVLLAEAKQSESILVCPEIDMAVLETLVDSKRKGAGNIVVIICKDKNVLEDVAALTGATLVGESSGIKFDQVVPQVLGIVTKIISTPKKTTFIASSKKIKEQIKKLNGQIKQTQNEWDKRSHRNRIAKLSGGIAIIRVGAPTDSEREYLRLKIEDAVNATKSALEEGVVEGGGLALYRIAQRINQNSIANSIFATSLKSPLKQIIENAGLDYVDILLNLPEGMGFDVKNNKYVNMFECGIIDPAKVTRSAIENATSAATTLMTAGCAISDKPEKHEN